MFNHGYRVKRIKLEQPKRRRSSDSIRSSSNRLSVNRSAIGNPALSNDVVETHAEPHGAESPSSLETLSSHAAQTVVAETTPQVFNSARPLSGPTRERATLCQEVGRSDTVSPNDQTIDFTTAPSDPIELAWWVAQQISHFQTDVRDSSQLLFEDKQSTTIDYPPEGCTRHSDEDVQLGELAEKVKLREDNRERKKRWRESNTEKNKDNDLRCRINKRAKTKFGPEPSAEKAAYVESEFNKRRTKREAKQRARALETGEFPSFAIAPELIDRPFSAQNPGASAEVQVAGDLLMNTLFGSSSSRPRAGKPEASNSLKIALENGALDSRPLVEALQIMAKNTDLMKGINARLNSERYDEEGDGNSGEENGQQSKQSASTRADSATSSESTLNHQSAEIIKALNAATALLNEMADTKTYASPYGNPPHPKKGMDDSGLATSNDASAETSSSKQATDGHGLDQSQIDALLALANGGSLSDDDDDKTIADPDEFDPQQLDSGGTAQSDSDIIATLQRYISQLMAERSGTENADESKLQPFKTTRSDPYGAQSVRDQAAILQSLFAQAGVSINTIMPREQGQATSQLYAHLSSRARSSTSAKTISSTQARSYGSTAQMHQRMLASPDVIAQAHQRPLQSITSNGNMMGLSIRTRTPEEIMKIKSYGYPPLPGQKIGAKRA